MQPYASLTSYIYVDLFVLRPISYVVRALLSLQLLQATNEANSSLFQLLQATNEANSSLFQLLQATNEANSSLFQLLQATNEANSSLFQLLQATNEANSSLFQLLQATNEANSSLFQLLQATNEANSSLFYVHNCIEPNICTSRPNFNSQTQRFMSSSKNLLQCTKDACLCMCMYVRTCDAVADVCLCFDIILINKHARRNTRINFTTPRPVTS